MPQVTLTPPEAYMALAAAQLYLVQQVHAWVVAKQEVSDWPEDSFNVLHAKRLVDKLDDAVGSCLMSPVANFIARLDEERAPLWVAAQLLLSESGIAWEHASAPVA